jgi:hypothetical protein
MTARDASRAAGALVLVVVSAGCSDALEQRLTIVDRPRVLAITTQPPEVLPGASVTTTALVAGPDGPLDVAPTWSLCTAPKPPTEDNAVADGCLGDAVIDLGAAPAITVGIPSDACRTYGPDVASTGFRPRDPDATGGYYQPIRAATPGVELAFAFARITCDLTNAPGELAEAYKTSYVANTNPALAGLAIDGVVVDPTRVPELAADREVTLTASWAASSVEAFLYFDPASRELVTRHEAMRVSWFATGGALAVDASALAEDDPATAVTTTWRTPSRPGPAWIWLVLRDSRGGLATATFELAIAR